MGLVDFGPLLSVKCTFLSLVALKSFYKRIKKIPEPLLYFFMYVNISGGLYCDK